MFSLSKDLNSFLYISKQRHMKWGILKVQPESHCMSFVVVCCVFCLNVSEWQKSWQHKTSARQDKNGVFFIKLKFIKLKNNMQAKEHEKGNKTNTNNKRNKT